MVIYTTKKEPTSEKKDLKAIKRQKPQTLYAMPTFPILLHKHTHLKSLSPTHGLNHPVEFQQILWSIVK